MLGQSALVSTLLASLAIDESAEDVLKLMPAVQMEFSPIHYLPPIDPAGSATSRSGFDCVSYYKAFMLRICLSTWMCLRA
jgi:hypothetical protein